MKIVKVILIIFFFLFNTKIWAGISIPIIISNDSNQNQQLYFGLDEKATDGIDTNLGEINAPRILPPDPTVFLAAFVIFDSVQLQEPVWSYRDYRPIKSISHYFVQYSIFVHHGEGKKLYFNWVQLPASIDSAFIMDQYGDSIVYINMKKSLKDSVKNEFITDYYINVWYNNPNATVIDNLVSDEPVTIYPNPFIQNLIMFSKSGSDFNFKIFSQIGDFVINGNSINSKVDISLSELNPGVYFVYITLKDGREIVKKLMKI
ncbi:MAG: T9SS type A sorting domain-containing protein [FCB group bacterium]|jgi:hypothetical protein